MDIQPKKPSFADAYERSGLSYSLLDAAIELAKVDRQVSIDMLLGHPVARADAEKILRALSEMTGQNYTLKTVRILLIPEKGKSGE